MSFRAGHSTIPPNGIDHLIYASVNLQRGMDEIENLLGVRPVRGGRHPAWGTHNALLSLGAGVYLEIIARDPELPAPARGLLVDIPEGGRSRLVTWVHRAEHLQGAAAELRDAGFKIGEIESGSRATPDGNEIRWHLTDPYAMPMDGAIPFLINWGTTPHPSTVVPQGGRFESLLIEHPEANHVRRALSVLGADVEVIEGDTFRLSSTLETTHGQVTIR